MVVQHGSIHTVPSSFSCSSSDSKSSGILEDKRDVSHEMISKQDKTIQQLETCHSVLTSHHSFGYKAAETTELLCLYTQILLMVQLSLRLYNAQWKYSVYKCVCIQSWSDWITARRINWDLLRENALIKWAEAERGSGSDLKPRLCLFWQLLVI